MRPHNVAFCQFKECPNLTVDECNKETCIFKIKRIKYWERTGKWPWTRKYEDENA